jgi:Cupin-like domain
VAELQPGDAIYIPPMWWHHVESLQQINALVNYWWKPVPANGHVPETAMGCLLHCILTFKSRPPAERAAWKGLLEHYVFDEADPAAHLPVERRGVLGELTPELATKLRESIRCYP